MTVAQDSAVLFIDLPKEFDGLAPIAFSGTERMSDLFQFELSLHSTKELKLSEANELVERLLAYDKNITFGVKGPGGKDRAFNGLIIGARCMNAAKFQLTVAPWLWLLTLNKDSRIFLDKSVPEIVSSEFDRLGYADYRMTLSEQNYPRHPQVVQYEESTADFVSRLLEVEGIFYCWKFDADNGKHTLVITDSVDVIESCGEPVEYWPADSVGFSKEDDAVSDWQCARQLTPGRYVVSDYFHERPHNSLEADAKTLNRNARLREFSVFDGHSGHTSQDDGARLAKRRIEGEEVKAQTFDGAGDVRSFTAGRHFQFRDDGQKYLLTAVHHQAAVDHFGYHNNFECVQLAQSYRPPRKTRHPKISGLQTAVVTGPRGSEDGSRHEVHTDEYGRVRVRFRWDRHRDTVSESSCWVRIAHAGGQMRIPRVGEEVLVLFEQGDPNRPLVVGSPFATPELLHFDTPTHRNDISFLQTFEGNNGRNQVRLHGKRGGEQFLIHAGRDFRETAQRHRFSKTDGDQLWEVDGNVWQESGQTTVIKSGMAIRLEAPEIVLVTSAGSFVKVGAAGVSIEGLPLVQLNCGNSAPPNSVQKPAPDALP